MSGLKRNINALQVPKQQFAVTPDEMDRYEVYSIVMPGTASNWFASAGTAGTSATGTAVVINAIPDYPRNLQFSLTGTGVGMAGTFTYNARDQFGSTFQEVLATGTATNGGTVAGTKVVAQFISGTLNYGTAVGAGTPAIGFCPTGTTCLFGLPTRIRTGTDVVLMSMVAGTGAVTVNGGTIGTMVVVGQHAVRSPLTLTGTQTINVWIRSQFDNSSKYRMTNLGQIQ